MEDYIGLVLLQCWLVGPDVTSTGRYKLPNSYDSVLTSLTSKSRTSFPGSWVILLKKAVDVTAENFT